MKMIHKKVLEQIKKQAEQGVFNLLERIIQTIDERNILNTLTSEDKSNFNIDLIGQPLYIIVITNNYGDILDLEYLDYDDAFAIYEMEVENLVAKDSAFLYSAIITGGNSFYGWEYTNKQLLFSKQNKSFLDILEEQNPHEAPKVI